MHACKYALLGSSTVGQLSTTRHGILARDALPRTRHVVECLGMTSWATTIGTAVGFLFRPRSRPGAVAGHVVVAITWVSVCGVAYHMSGRKRGERREIK